MAGPRKVPFVTLSDFPTVPAPEPKKRRKEDEIDLTLGDHGKAGTAATGAGGDGGGGGGGAVFGNVKVSGGDAGEPRGITVRLNLCLSEPSDQASAEFSYSELVQSRQVKRRPPQGLAPAIDPTDPLANEQRERQEVEALAKKFESKYGNSVKKKRKDRMQDLIDIGFGYDESDSFIDNSEAYDELVPASLTTKLGGFYINTGTLQFRAASESEGEDGGKAGKLHKRAKDGEERVIKKRKRKEGGSLEEKKPKKNRLPKQGVLSLSSNRPEKKKRKKLMKDSLHLAAILRRFTPENSEARKKSVVIAAAANPQGPAHPARPATGAALLVPRPAPLGPAHADLSVADPAVMSLLGSTSEREMLQDLMGELDFGLLDSPQPCSPAKAENCLPLPAPLLKRIEDLRLASRQFDQEGRKKFFTLDMNNILLDIELQVQEQRAPVRFAVYSHLEAFVPCTKEVLQKRLKKLSLNVQDDRLRAPLLKLKLAVCSMMPEQITRYNMDCIARVAKQQSEVEEKNGSEEEDEEKPGKRVMGPRKKFIWDDKLRTLLCNLVRVKLGLYELDCPMSAEDYLKNFLEAEVKPLWPKGWMQARILFKESRTAHSHLTDNTVKKKMVPAPKSKPKVPEAGLAQKHNPGSTSVSRRPHPYSPETIYLSDSPDDDLLPPSPDSISHALALLSSAAKGLIQDRPPSPRGTPNPTPPPVPRPPSTLAGFGAAKGGGPLQRHPLTHAHRPNLPRGGVKSGTVSSFSTTGGQKAVSHSNTSTSLTSSSPAPSGRVSSPSPVASTTNHEQRQRTVGGASQGTKPIMSRAPVAVATSLPVTSQLSQLSSAGSGLLGTPPPSLPLGFGMLGGLVPVSLPFQFPPLLNFTPPTGPTGGPGGDGAVATSNNSGYSLAQNLYKSLQVRPLSALPPHLQLAFSDINQSQEGDMKRKSH
ncbi:hypothetical protein AAFF_G00339140 [Aldrovandia affinis]|uniref:Ubinuclein 2 n=1 Tax=Aldrovandia affinis TaxID=143900 RepID=A0AAD7WP11_9TELE|nr:hypothetical protein AAFF_G00339140 [Aldrovandia affinis]